MPAAVVIPEKHADDTISKDVESVSKRIDQLGQMILAVALTNMAKIEKGGVVSAEEQLRQQALVDQFKIVEAIYNKLVKMKRIPSGEKEPAGDFEKGFIEKMKEYKSTMGDIVQQIPQTKAEK